MGPGPILARRYVFDLREKVVEALR